MNKCDLAWQAGIIDGEGCLTISNTDRALLTPFIEMWGGAIYVSRENRKAWARALTWHCPDKMIKPLLEAVGPYLRGKQRQAAIILSFVENKKRFKRVGLGQHFGSAPLGAEEIRFRENLWNQARLLNSKGQFSRRAVGEAA